MRTGYDRRKSDRRRADRKFGHTVRSIIIVCAVGIVSFFVGQRVIPEKNAVVSHPNEVVVDTVYVPVPADTPAEPLMEVSVPVQTSEPTPAPTRTAPVSVPASTQEPVQPAPPPPPAANRPQTLKIERAAVATAIEDRAPKGVADKFSKNTRALYYFTHVTGARDTTTSVMHRWYHEGKLVQTSILQIRSPSWRTHSRRNLTEVPGVPDVSGNWKVEAVESKTGKVLESASFVVE